MRHLIRVVFGVAVVSSSYVVQAQTTPPKIGTELLLASRRVQKGSVVRASLIIDVPKGYHVNAHNPISKFALATKVELDIPNGAKVGQIIYPKAIVRQFSFTNERLGVYENRVVIKFDIMLPRNQPTGDDEITARLKYQSCSNEVCFPPMKREVSTSFTVW